MSSNDDGRVRLPQRLSPTSIDRWRQCPRRFLYQDVQKREFQDIKTYEQTLGEVIHKVLEGLFRIEPSRRDEEAVEQLLDSNVGRLSSVPAQRKGNLERLREEAEIQLRSFVQSHRVDQDTLKVEQPFQLRLTDGRVIRTRVDRIDRAESGSLQIVDYKSGRVQLDEADMAREVAAIVQLLAVGAASQIPVEKVIWIYLRSGDTIQWWPEQEDVESATEWLVAVIEEMKRDREFEANPGGHCAYCPFTTICPAWTDAGHAADEVDEAA